MSAIQALGSADGYNMEYPGDYTLTMLRTPTMPATNMTMSNKWPCGFNAKRPSITRPPTTAGGNLGELQARTLSTEVLVMGLMALILVQRRVTVIEATQGEPRTNHHTQDSEGKGNR